MIPIQVSGTQDSGPMTSSNLVLWQGPDIPCLQLCNGDSISDVTAKLAQQLCDLLDQTNLSGFDLTCFNPVCPTLTNFHDLIQFIINQICSINTDCCGGSSAGGTGQGSGSGSRIAAGADCPDCLVTVAPCFYTTDQFGTVITQMQLSDYARAIGAQVCSQVNQIANLNIVLSQQQSQITNLQIQVNAIPIPVTLPIFVTTCLTDQFPSIPVNGISLSSMISGIENAFCSLRTATGFPSNILQSILRQCTSLDISPALNLPGVNMGSIPGWVLQSSYSTMADSINNMWITICDMRAAVSTILKTCCPNGCAGVTLNPSFVFTSPNLVINWGLSSAPGFQDCNPAGSWTTITDALGNIYTLRIPIEAYLGSTYTINLTSVGLNLNTNLAIQIDSCLQNTQGSQCERCLQGNIINQSDCPALTLSADGSSVTWGFTNSIQGLVTYQVILKQSGVIVASQSITTSTNGPLTGIFSGLYTGTVYTVTIIIQIGQLITNTCPVGVITTTSLPCAPPTQVSATGIFS